MAAQARKRKKPMRPTTVEAVTTGTVIRMESPTSGRKPKPNTAVVVAQEINPVHGFVGFLKEYAVITVAIGFAIAAQAQVLIKQLSASFIDPMYALFFNGQALSVKTTVISFHGREQAFAWGAFVYSLMNFIFMLLVIFLVVKFFALDKLKKEDAKK